MRYNLTTFTADNLDHPGSYAANAPRGAARGREEDSLMLLLTWVGGEPLSPEETRRLLQQAGSTFFATSGSVTNAIRALVDSLNKHLATLGDGFSEPDERLTAALSLATIHHGAMFVAQVGHSQVMLFGRQGGQRFFDPDHDPRGLGAASVVRPRLFQADILEGDFVLLGAELPSEFDDIDGSLQELALTLPDIDLPGAILVVQFNQGAGQVRRGILDVNKLPEDTDQVEGQEIVDVRAEDETLKEDLPPQNDVAVTLSVTPPEEDTLIQGLFGNIPIAPETEPELPEANIPAAESDDETMRLPVSEVEPLDTEAEEILPEPDLIAEDTHSIQPALKPVDVDQLKQGALKGVANSAGWLKKIEDRAAAAVDKVEARSAAQGKTVPQLSALAKWLIAILVPLLVVAITTGIYIARGADNQYAYLMAQAEASANNAALVSAPASQRQMWQDTINWLDQAAAYGGREEPEISSLRLEAQQAIDQLEGAVRLDYHRAYPAGSNAAWQITRVIPLNNDLFLLDAAAGSVVHLSRSTSGYALDENFRCGPGTYDGIAVGALVDVSTVQISNPAKAPLIAIDAAGNTLYCAVSKTPVASRLVSPDGGWADIRAITTDGSRLYVLDPGNNVLWFYRGVSSGFAQPPNSYFDTTPVKLQDAVGIAVSGDELFMVYESGKASHCLASNVTGAVDCIDPYLFTDNREAAELVDFSKLAFSQLAYSPPPDPSIFFLEPVSAELYQFSLRLNLNRVLRSGSSSGALPRADATAFAVAPNRSVFLAFGSDLYFATLP